MKKEVIALLSLLVLFLFVAGCGRNKSQAAGEAVKDIVSSEKQGAEGTPCSSNTDCPKIPEPLGEPFCLSGNHYQRYKYYRCSFREPHVCESVERDMRVGYC